VNPNDQSYINIDALLSSTLSSKTSTETLEFLRRDELARRLVDKMQAWYEISVESKEPIVKSVCIPELFCTHTDDPCHLEQKRLAETDIGHREDTPGPQSINAHH